MGRGATICRHAGMREAGVEPEYLAPDENRAVDVSRHYPGSNFYILEVRPFE